MMALACGVMGACGGTVLPVAQPRRAAPAAAPAGPARTDSSAPADPLARSDAPIIPAARVSGRLVTADGRQLLSGAVVMTSTADDGPTAMPSPDVTILPDGSFSFGNVPPGTYQIRAQAASDPGRTPLFGTFNVTVDARDVTHADVVLRPGATVTGHVIIEAVRGPRPLTLGAVRVHAPLADGSRFGDSLTGDVHADGSYALRAIMPGTHIIAVQGLPFPWVLKDVSYRGQDVTDAGIDAASGAHVDDVRVTVTDVASDLRGTVRDGRGTPVAGAVVLIVPLAEQFWTPTSRRFRVLRTDAVGRYRTRGLPPGEYRAIASTDVDESLAYRPAFLHDISGAGIALTLGSLETRELDLPLVSMPARHRLPAR